jgi:hypothetical protein
MGRTLGIIFCSIILGSALGYYLWQNIGRTSTVILTDEITVTPTPKVMPYDSPYALGKCQRDEPYVTSNDLLSRVENALPRLEQSPITPGLVPIIPIYQKRNLINCLYLRYDNLSYPTNALFTFTERDKLEIVLSTRLQTENPIYVDAILLHEVAHAILDADAYYSGVTPSRETEACYASEINAHLVELSYVANVPKDKLTAAHGAGYTPGIGQINDFVAAVNGAEGEYTEQKVESYVRNHPAYKKQCNP